MGDDHKVVLPSDSYKPYRCRLCSLLIMPLSLAGKSWPLTSGAFRSHQTRRGKMEKSSSLWNVWGSRSSSGSTSLTRAQPASTSPTTLPCTRCPASLWRTRGESPEPAHCSSVLVRALLLSVFIDKKTQKRWLMFTALLVASSVSNRRELRGSGSVQAQPLWIFSCHNVLWVLPGSASIRTLLHCAGGGSNSQHPSGSGAGARVSLQTISEGKIQGCQPRDSGRGPSWEVRTDWKPVLE